MKNAAVFLDRDGVVIEETGYLADPAQVRLLPGTAEAISRLNAAGLKVVVVTNQSGVARGFFPESRIAQVHARLDALLANFGARIDAYYYCPHHPDEGVPPYRKRCACRKPAPGLLLKASKRLDLDLSRSFMIGDKPSDLEAGAAAGCRTILVMTGYGLKTRQRLAEQNAKARLPDHTAEDLAEAVGIILAGDCA